MKILQIVCLVVVIAFSVLKTMNRRYQDERRQAAQQSQQQQHRHSKYATGMTPQAEQGDGQPAHDRNDSLEEFRKKVEARLKGQVVEQGYSEVVVSAVMKQLRDSIDDEMMADYRELYVRHGQQLSIEVKKDSDANFGVKLIVETAE